MAAEQARVFLAMALCGAAVAFLYDVTLALRRALGLGGVLSGALDIAMGAAAAAAMTITALCLGVDPLRLFAFAGMAAGFALYRASMGTIVRKMSACVKKWSKKMRKEEKGCRKMAD